jgi:hypothetical protein
MRVMLKITIPTETANRAINDGSFAKVMEATIAKWKPEAAYFVTDKGRRCAVMVFDMQAASDLPVIAEPLFVGLNAEIEVQPAMNLEDLKKGLAAAA